MGSVLLLTGWREISEFDRPQLDIILKEKRKSVKAYKWFYDNVLSHVVGRHYWNKYQDEKGGTAMATVSDEALALLLIENSWSCWEEKFNHALIQMGEQEQQGGSPKTRPKYTKRDSGVKENKGWSAKGIERFNELYNEVKEDRKERSVDFDAEYKEEKMGENKRKRKRRPVIQRSAVVAVNEFDSDCGGASD